MRIVLVLVLASCLAWSVGEYVAVESERGPTSHITIPGNMPFLELSRDNGSIASAWVYLNGANTYAGCQYDTPELEDNLGGIKYYVWSQGWPDSAYQGFTVCAWRMTSGTPGNIIWPTNGNSVYNPNTGGNWIIQPVSPTIGLSWAAPTGFVVGIGFLYTYPASDAFGVDNTGPGPYDWAQASGAWTAAPYGRGSARAILFLNGEFPPPWWYEYVEPSTLGSLRALYR